jgi:hypothetical protein
MENPMVPDVWTRLCGNPVANFTPLRTLSLMDADRYPEDVKTSCCRKKNHQSYVWLRMVITVLVT